MKWAKEALEIVNTIPLPPVMAHLAKLDAERRARHKGLDTVTIPIAQATEKGYEKKLGSEAFDIVRAMLRGDDMGLPDEFFEEDAGELYSIQACPVKFGACPGEKRQMVQQIVTPVRTKLKELEITKIIMDKACTPLMSHHIFHVAIIGCPNCCLSPYFSDFGIICTYEPAVRNTGCTQCKLCIKYCIDGAIVLNSNAPAIDFQKCVLCGGCVKECKENVLFTKQKGYKVVVGGHGARHPLIAQTVSECTDTAGVLKILENCINLFKNTPAQGHGLTFHELIKQHGVSGLGKI